MFPRERRLQKARALLPACRPCANGTWVDVGSGDGVFAEGLLEVTRGVTCVVGFDNDRSKLSRLLAWGASSAAKQAIRAVQGDFARPLPFRELRGLIAANALHFVPDSTKAAVLAQFLSALAPGGQLILVEYNATQGNGAVPFPRRESEWVHLIVQAGFERVRVAARAPSSFLGEMVAISGFRPMET